MLSECATRASCSAVLIIMDRPCPWDFVSAAGHGQGYSGRKWWLQPAATATGMIAGHCSGGNGQGFLTGSQLQLTCSCSSCACFTYIHQHAAAADFHAPGRRPWARGGADRGRMALRYSGVAGVRRTSRAGVGFGLRPGSAQSRPRTCAPEPKPDPHQKHKKSGAFPATPA